MCSYEYYYNIMYGNLKSNKSNQVDFDMTCKQEVDVELAFWLND